MHELSIACSIVELATEEAAQRNVRVLAIHLKLGVMSGVVEEALIGSYEMASAGTVLEGSKLIVQRVPLMVQCPVCKERREIASVQWLRCPVCGTPTPDIVEGKELQVTALEVDPIGGGLDATEDRASERASAIRE